MSGINDEVKTDLLEIIDLATKDKLNDFEIEWNEDNCMTIVLCAKGYPGNHIKNSEIKNYLKLIKIKQIKFFMQEPIKKMKKYFQVAVEY